MPRPSAPGATAGATVASRVRPDAVLVRMTAASGSGGAAMVPSARRLPTTLAAVATTTGLRIEPEFLTPPPTVGFRSVTTAARADAIAQAIADAGLDRDWIVHLDGRMSPAAAVELLRATSGVERAQPIVLASVAAVPDDSLWSNAYYLYQSSRMDSHAPEAWDITRGDPSQVIAIIDTGVLLTHPDLVGPGPEPAGNLWTNAAEANGAPGVDDDHNGYVDDVHGWDFISLDTDTITVAGEDWRDEDADPNDFVGHGTSVAGIAAALTDNHIGIAGVAWNVRVMPLRVGFSARVQPAGLIDESAAARAILYAATNGATVINCSFSTDDEIDLMGALDVAYRAGIPVVTAAGNNGSGHAMADRPEVISVAAVDAADQLTRFTNTGPYVDLCAAGLNVATTTLARDDAADSTHRCLPAYTADANGTSYSAPLVAAGIALMQSDRQERGLPPLDPLSVALRLEDTADDIAAANPGATGYGAGRLNYLRALTDPPGSFAAELQGEPIGAAAVAPAFGPSAFAVIATLAPGLERIGAASRAVDWHVSLPGSPIGSPSIADLGNGELGIFVAADFGYVCGYSADGQPLPGWPVRAGTPPYDGLASPALGDVNGDGYVDVVWGDGDGHIWAWSSTGQPLAGFPVTVGSAGQTVWIALADLGGDGRDEIVALRRDGQLQVLNGDGTTLDGWPQQVASGLAEPPIVAMLASGSVPAIVACVGYSIVAFKVDGSRLWTTPLDLPTAGAPAVADADGDGVTDIVVGEVPGAVTAIRGNTGGVLRTFPSGSNLVHGDAMLEYVASGTGARGVAWTLGDALRCYDSAGSAIAIRPGHGDGTPTFADFDGNGREDVLVPAARERALYVCVTPFPAAVNPRWATGRGNAARTGSALQPSDVIMPGPPQRIADLRWNESPRHVVTLSWAAPVAWRQIRAASYDLRISTSSLDADGFALATVIPNAPAPATAGAPQRMQLTDLEDYATYWVAIESIDSLGQRSPISNVATIQLPSTTLTSVSNLHLEDQSSSELLVGWTTASRPPFPTSLTIAATLADPTGATFDTAAVRLTVPAGPPGTAQHVTLTGVMSGRTYYVGVRGADSLGFVSDAPVIAATTMPPAVRDLQVVGRATNMLYLQWTSPGHGLDPAASYDVAAAPSWFDASGFDAAPIHRSIAARSSGAAERDSVVGVAPDEPYWVAVRVRDANGVASFVSDIAYTSAPDGIWDLKVQARDDTSLTLSWSTPWMPFVYSVSYYEIAVFGHPFAAKDFSAAETLCAGTAAPGRQQTLRIAGLVRGHSYWIAVRARDSLGLLSPVGNIVASVNPPAVSDLRLVSRGRRDMHLVWTVPPIIGAPIARYDVVVSGRPLREAEFDTAGVHWAIPVDGSGSSVQTAVVGGLVENQGYWVALRVRDATGLVSPVSNAVSTLRLPAITETATGFEVWPQPVRTELSIRWDAPGGGVAPPEARIIDATGRLTRRLRSSAGDGSVLVWDRKTDAGGWAPAGVYFVRLDAGPYHVVKRIVVVN